MLGFNPTPIGSITTLNGSVPNMNQIPGMANDMVNNAVRRLPQVQIEEFYIQRAYINIKAFLPGFPLWSTRST